jgi:hypothetical protein
VITGFNTDVEFEGITYHVQTEDKGLERPVIMSLVYDRGTILASKRTPYTDLIEAGFDEKVLAERLNKQHRLMCAAIKAGRLKDLIKLATGAPAAQKRAQPAQQAPAAQPAANVVSLRPLPTAPSPAPPTQPPDIGDEAFDGLVLEALVASETGEPVLEKISIFEEIILPDEAVTIISELEGMERPVHNKLSIEILGESSLRSGESRKLSFMVCRGTLRKVVTGAQVMVKILGSSFRPVLFHSLTDSNGIATMDVKVPGFEAGRAAFLARAVSNGEEVELRRSIASGRSH